jgi:hypothetical protein
MAGPMNMSFYPFPELFCIGLGVILIYAGSIAAGIPRGLVILILACVSLWPVVTNACAYPVEDGAFYMGRYGRDWCDRTAPPTQAEHFFAFSVIASLFYWGTIWTFPKAFAASFGTLLKRVAYYGLLAVLAIILVCALGNLYNFFTHNLHSGVISSDQMEVNRIKSALVPLGLVISGLVLIFFRKLRGTALIMFISGGTWLALAGIILAAYKHH